MQHPIRDRLTSWDGSLILAGLAILCVTILCALGRLEAQSAVTTILAVLGVLGAYHVPAPGQRTVPPAA